MEWGYNKAHMIMHGSVIRTKVTNETYEINMTNLRMKLRLGSKSSSSESSPTSNQIKIKKFYLKSVHFITIQELFKPTCIINYIN